jgi:hypothetical protein
LFPFLLATYIALVPINTPYPAVFDCVVQHESHGEQFCSEATNGMGTCTPAKYGTPLWSNTKDVGVMQIHNTWIPTAKNMGLDVINNAVDNIQFGIWLKNKYGFKQWSTYEKYCAGTDDS